ncbi:hypothetical protein vBKpnF48_5 [Klebsiella phage vB_Kpn_F48]|uniref:Uncharacterized protein n=1 Tax=Klebsiella phage vB_Kpn_F48 TaxID=2070028 RepID=A0A2I6UF68_9CAUD|nr:hypothetical protein HWB49_gp005 [Klebsiella phage vB_Kpn_F48]AUO78630.1 hypothetical protein vBKpnF48_5 [Klebsiella phage vB_Kpn_F48]
MKRNPKEEMAKAVEAINDAIRHAKVVADHYNTEFTISPAYGMGGTYYSPGFLKKELEQYTEQGNPSWATINQHEYYTSLETGGWVSSSMEC